MPKKHKKKPLDGVVDRRYFTPSGSLRQIVWKILWDRQNGVCAYCDTSLRRLKQRREPITLDHRVPYWRGGKGEVENLAFACKKCNLDKGSLTDVEYLALRSSPDWVKAYRDWLVREREMRAERGETPPYTDFDLINRPPHLVLMPLRFRMKLKRQRRQERKLKLLASASAASAS